MADIGKLVILSLRLTAMSHLFRVMIVNSGEGGLEQKHAVAVHLRE